MDVAENVPPNIRILEIEYERRREPSQEDIREQFMLNPHFE